MTKEEIKTLIAEKISGQGNQVDIGGALADVLNELVDAMGGEPVVHQVTIQSAEDIIQDVNIDFAPILGENISFILDGEEFTRGQIISVSDADVWKMGCVCTMGDDAVSPMFTTIRQHK